jgi:hypothetical protein
MLTRLGYSLDEVVISLVTSMLLNTDLKESYYWLYELYFSDIDVFPILWKIYFDFYYILNPRLEEYIEKKHKLWLSTKELECAAFVLRNMVRCKPTSDIFIIRQFAQSLLSDTYKIDALNANMDALNLNAVAADDNAVDDWIYAYPLSYHNLLWSIKKCQYKEICYNLIQLLDSNEEYCKAEYINYLLQKYFNLKEKKLRDEELYSGNDIHYLLALIIQNIHLCENMLAGLSLKVGVGSIFLTTKPEDLLQIVETNTTKIRLYEINKEIVKSFTYADWSKNGINLSLPSINLPTDFIFIY